MTVNQALDSIERYLNEGYSIGMARKMALGSDGMHGKLAITLTRTPRYLNLLNKYLEANQRHYRYYMASDGKLKSKKLLQSSYQP